MILTKEESNVKKLLAIPHGGILLFYDYQIRRDGNATNKIMVRKIYGPGVIITKGFFDLPDELQSIIHSAGLWVVEEFLERVVRTPQYIKKGRKALLNELKERLADPSEEKTACVEG